MQKNNKGRIMKSNITFEEFKNSIDSLIENNEYKKLRQQENYFDIMNNYWIIDKYIAKNGQCNSELFPNTFSAYEESIKNGYAINIPVQILDDDSLVCFSHKNISKVIPTISGYLNKYTLKELKDIKLNINEEKIPTLDETLDFIAGRTQIILELHNESISNKMEDKVIASIKNYIQKFNCHHTIAVMSMNPYTLEYFNNEFPYVTRILKSGAFNDKMYGTIPTPKLKKLKYHKIANADFICYSAELLPYKKIRKCKPVGVLAHSVSTQSQYISVAPYCDNIIFSHFTPTI